MIFFYFSVLLFERKECNKKTCKKDTVAIPIVCCLLLLMALAVLLWSLRLLMLVLLLIQASVRIQGFVLADSGRCSADKRALSAAPSEDKAREKLAKRSNR